MANRSINFAINFNANTSGINQAKKALEQLRDLTTKDIAIFNNTGMDDAGLKKARTMLLDIQTEAGKAEKAMEAAFNQKLNTVNMQKFKEELVKSGTSLEHFKTTMSQAGPIGEKAFTEMSAGIANVRYQTVQTTTILDKMAASLQRNLTTFISMNIINKVKGSINEAYGYVKNLDTSLNEIRIVTGKSADEMDNFAEKANKAAASLGQATTDYTKASTIYYQQGLGDEEVAARTDVTLKAANTTGQDTKTVANNLTALWNGFNAGAEEAEIYVDRLAALAASTASNLDELTTAMSKTASMANVMGVSEEQLAAQIATVVSVTRQAPESVGTAFKTIYARISDISTGAEDAETTLGNYSSKLAAMGVNVLDSSGKLRDMGEVIEEVGGKWGSYSKEQQVAIAGIMGGQRQVNQITALFDNWDEYTESIETMANAEGTLQKQQDIYMESAEGQLQKLRTEWEGVLDSLLSSDDIIKVAKSIQPIFESLEKVIDAFGGGIGILTKFSPLLLSLISPKISEGIAKIGMSFENTKINAEIAKSEVEGFQKQLREKAGEEAVISGYTQQIQDLINKYGELRDSMSIEQKNQFKESLNQLIENEGPKARKELEEYQKGLRAIYELDAGKDNNILKDVIKTEDKDKLDEYRKKLEELEKTLTGSSEDIKKNFDNIKKQIQDTLGDSEVGQNLIKNLEQSIKDADYSKSAKAVWDQFGEALSNESDIDLSVVQQKVNDSFGEGNAAALTYMAGINQLQDAQKNLHQTQEELKAQNIDIAQEQEKRHEILEKTKELEEQMSHNVRLQTDERTKYNQAFQEQDEILNTYLTGEDKSIAKLKEEYEQVKNTSGAQSEKAQALQNAIEKFEEYEKVANDSMEKEEELKKELNGINHEYEEQQQKLTEVRKTLAPYTNALQKVNTLTNRLSQGEVSLEEVNEQMADTARQGADAIHDLGENVGQTTNHMAEVQQQSAKTSAEVLTLRQSFEELKKINLAQNMMNIFQAGVAVYTSFQSIIGLGSIWNDDDLTTGEKLVQTFTTLATVVPILISSVRSAATAFTALKEAEAGSAIASTVKTAVLTVQAVVTKLATKEAAALTIAEIAAGKAAVPLVPLWLAIGAAVAAAAAVIAVIVLAIKAWTKANETSTERLKKANEALEEAKKKYNELNDAISDYKDAKKGLEELTEGTQEFMDAIVELNEKVLKLIETYPELAQYLEVGEHGELLLNNEGLKEYIELQKESLRLQQQSTMTEGLSTKGDKRKLEEQAMAANGGAWKHTSFHKTWTLESVETVEDRDEAAAFQYSKLLEQQEKADKAKIAAYLKSYESFAKISSNTASAIAQDLQNEYKDDIEGLKAAMADEEAMLKRAEEYEKRAKNFANKGFDFSNADIKNGDFSNISRADIQTIFKMDRDSLADMLGVDEASEEIDEFLGQLSMAWVEMKELPSPFENWAEDIDLGIVEKFEKDVGKINDEILQGLGNELKRLGNTVDIDEFTTDLVNIDWSQGEEGLIAFREKYKDLGEEIENYIQAQKEANVIYTQSLGKLSDLTSAMGVISQKKFGDMLNEKDYNKLIGKFEGLEKYFQKVGDKYQYVATNNKTVLEELKQAYREESKEIIELSKTFSNMDTNKLLNMNQISTFTRINSQSDAAVLTEKNQNKAQFFGNLSESTLESLAGQTGLTIARIKEIGKMSYAAIKENEEALKDYEAIVTAVTETEEIKKQRDKEFIAAQINSLQELDTAVKDGTVSYEAAEKEREYIRNKELQSLGVTEEAYKNYLKAIEKDIGEINNTEIMISFKIDLNGKKAFENIDKMFADLPKKADRSSADTVQAMSNLTENLKKELDIDISSFLDFENFDLFEKMVGGDEESYHTLISHFEQEINMLYTSMQGNLTAEQEAQVAQYQAAIEWLGKYQDKWGEAAEERLNNIKQQSIELQKSQAEFARSQTQRSISKVEDKMAHATGDDWVKLYNRREQLRKQEIADAKEIQKLEMDSLETNKALYKTKLEAANVNMIKLQKYIEQGKTLNEIVGLMKLEGENVDLVYNYLNSITDINQTRIKQEQEIADLEEEQAGTLASIYEVRAATTSKSRNQSQKNIQSEISQIDTQMASATGEDWVKLYNKRKQLQDKYLKGMYEEKQNLKDIEDSNKASLSILGDKIKFDEQGYAIAVDEKNMTTDELDLMSTYNDSLTDRLDMEQQITDEEEAQKGILANKYDIEAATTDKIREREKTNIQNEISRIEDAMAHATGKAYINLQKQKQDAEQRYLKILENESAEAKNFTNSKKEELKILGDKITYDKNGYAIAVDGAEITTEELEKIDEYNSALDDQLDKEQQITEEKRKQYDILLDTLAQIDSGYDESEAEKDLDRREEKVDEILRTADPNSKEYKDALAEKEKIRGERYILAKSERDDFAEENKIEIDKEGNVTTQYTDELKKAGITVDEKTGKASLEDVKQKIADDLGIPVEELEGVLSNEEKFMAKAKEAGYDETWAQDWKDRIDLIKKNNDAIDTYYEKDKKLIDIENSYTPTWTDELASNIEASQNKISSLDNQIEQKKEEIANANDSDKAALIEELNELEKQKEEEQEILKGYFAEQQTENVNKAVNGYTGLREGIKAAIDKAKDEGQDDLAESLSGVYKNFSDKTDEELEEGLNALIEEKGSLLTEKDLEDFFGFDKLDDTTKEALKPYIKTIMATKDAQVDLNETTEKFELPYDEYAKTNAALEVNNEKQKNLTRTLEKQQGVLDELKEEQQYLYGDDLVANLEAQKDALEDIIQTKKDQIELDKKEIELREKAKNDADNKKTTAKTNLETTLEGFGKNIDINDYLMENGEIDGEKLSKELGKTLSKEDLTNVQEYIDAYNAAVKEGKTATEALAEARQALADDTKDLSDTERAEIEIEKQIIQTQLSQAEDVIKREAEDMYVLNKAAKETADALEKVNRLSSDSTGSALVELLADEIELQKKELENLEQQLTKAKKELNDYIDLYNNKIAQIAKDHGYTGELFQFEIDENGQISNLPEFYNWLESLPDDLRVYIEPFYEGWISNIENAGQKVGGLTDEIKNETYAIEDNIKAMKKADLEAKEKEIQRETNVIHALTEELRLTEKAIADVQKEQDGLTGQALINKLQEEIQLQEKKKALLEQQLLQIKNQIQQLTKLYSAYLLANYGLSVNFSMDGSGVSNLDEIYNSINGLEKNIRGQALQTVEGFISTLNSLGGQATSTEDSIDSMSDTIEDLNKKLKETEEQDVFKTHEEKWNYEEQQLKKISRALNQIQKDQSKLSGNALIANLDAQQKMLDKQIEAQKRKLELMKAELRTMQAMLTMQGVMFDADGFIANYAEVFARGDEKVNGYMQSYQQLYDSIMDLEDGIQETYDKKADLEIQKTQERLRMFNAKIDVELDLTKAKREWQNFKRQFLNTLNGLSELNDNILENTKQNMKDIYDITTKDVVLLTDHVNKIIHEIRLMQNGGTSSLYGTDQQTALSDLANYRQQIQDSLSSLKEKMEQVNEAYLQQLDKIKGKFDDQLSNYELIQGIIEHDMNLVKILRGDQAYEELARYYDKATANYEQQIQFLRKQVDYWKTLMDKEVVGSEKWEKFQQNWKDALSKLNSAVDAALNNIVAKYDAKINAILSKIKKNTKLDWKLEKWDLDKQLNDMFLDKVSTEYSLQKLQSQYMKEAAKYEDDPAIRQQILDLMQKQVMAYRDLSKESIRKGRLTEREVELANKQFELEMKRLELQKAEEEMSNKTQMRLRRDSSGDYRYEYVAKQDDEDKQKLEDLRDEILDLEEEIRLYAEETRQEVVDTYTSAIETALAGIQQAYDDYKDGLINDAELQEKLNYYQQWLSDMGAAAATQYDVSVRELTTATYEEIEDLGQRALDDIYNLSQSVEATMTELYPTFGDVFETLDQEIINIQQAVNQALSEMTGLLAEMKSEIYAIGDAAGINFDMLIDGTDETIDAMYQLIDDNYELLDQYDQELNQIESLIDELERLQDAYRDVYDAAMEAVDAALELREVAQDIPNYSSKINNNININMGSGGSNSSSSSKTPTWMRKGLGTGTSTKKTTNNTRWETIEVLKQGSSPAEEVVPPAAYIENVSSGAPLRDDGEEIRDPDVVEEYLEALKKIQGYATGGYTGAWGSEGKIALLHEKELVLNADDTKNMLKMVAMARQQQTNDSDNIVTQALSKINSLVDMTYEIYQKIFDNTAREMEIMMAAANNINNIATNNTTNNINANFPNAVQHNEIEMALQNLSNATSQRLGLNRRR